MNRPSSDALLSAQPRRTGPRLCRRNGRDDTRLTRLSPPRRRRRRRRCRCLLPCWHLLLLRWHSVTIGARRGAAGGLRGYLTALHDRLPLRIRRHHDTGDLVLVGVVATELDA